MAESDPRRPSSPERHRRSRNQPTGRDPAGPPVPGRRTRRRPGRTRGRSAVFVVALLTGVLAASAGTGQALASASPSPGTGWSASAGTSRSASPSHGTSRSPSSGGSGGPSSGGSGGPSSGSSRRPSPGNSRRPSPGNSRRPSPGNSRSASPSSGPNYATPTHTGYLQSHAAADHMGRALHYRRAASVSRAAVPLLAAAADPVYGNDVSSYQGSVNWSQMLANGGKFSYIKATEGTYYKSPYFSQQYSGAYDVGMIRGAYAFAIPSYSSGAAQADYFAGNGGGWSADSHTLPGVLDIEYNPYGAQCYGLSQGAMVSWISAFVNEYHARSGRWAVIYTTYNWWSACTGNSRSFASNDPLWIANYGNSAGTLPAGWSYYTFWQYADSGTFPGDQDVFNGAADRLLALANNR